MQKAVTRVMDSVERSRALFGDKANAISQLCSLANECGAPDWDRNGALPLEHLAVFKAVAFVRVLPKEVPLPEFAPDPDGSISLDWIASRNRHFSLSVGTSDRLPYAWLDGTDKGHAVARFDGEIIPSRILEGIKAISSGGSALLRSR
ncbi:MAG: hypothetical protein HY017_12630 [Betaproteobacteria bacterium]|nr:hypothetical protein [Betaproteobacteria bacterium]